MILFVILNFLNNIINKLLKGFTMKKFLSKTTKILMPISLIAMILAFSNIQQAFSQEGDSVLSKTVFVVKDAVGNTDTVVFIVKEGATNGIDAELGEVNLYGQEPTKDLDLRIIQRTTVNCKCADFNFWLCPSAYWQELDGDYGGGFDSIYCDFGGEFTFSSDENIDLKVDYRRDTIDWNNPPYHWQPIPNSYVLKVYAKHYPVSIYLESRIRTVALIGFLFNEEDGEYVKETSMYWDIEDKLPYIIHTFNDASENNLLWFLQQNSCISVDDPTHEQPPLYPNPASEFIMISEGRFGETFTISDINGKTVKTVTVEYYPYSVDIRELQRGIYFLQSQGNIIFKFIKE